jgi:hypothetical protein
MGGVVRIVYKQLLSNILISILMKKIHSLLGGLLLLFLFIAASCTQDSAELTQQAISKDVLNQVASLGFNTNDVQVIEEGYLVEGDIILTKEDLKNLPAGVKLRIAETEQYHTTNLVNAPRTITVSTSGNVSSGFSTAVNNAIARYNAENLQLTFQRVSSGGNINIRIVNTGQYIASAGFPSGGNPYGEIKYAKKYTNGYSDGFMTTVIAHEMGHCIGFRHTDYMNRAYSCGSGGDEGASTVGAIHIPGTPTDPDAKSWMLACLGATTDRPFNANDKTALNYLY